ncbi:hypothetical protein E1B28_007282 [Marasmius oreades]|uniref:Cleavage stimulation factor subunit 2 hinge domain-containing protein n=1 Tax=Marasmius oreades TaxID=181124 RepID=A0A9P7UTL7_9AGAR|nr:uncharacterized protein E1B28_007282 [Marasmius oreades]KAG7093618.1 hypothetical protein E1B28_007282 [Marasmius oreades]
MSSSVDQLLELILQLKKTTPAAAKQILNSQPQIAYAVITLLVSMNAIDIEVFKKTLADFATSQTQAATAATPSQSTPAPAPAIPPHMQQNQQLNYRAGTPPTATPTPPIAQPQPGYSHGYPQPQGPAGYRYGVQSTPQSSSQYGSGPPGGGYGGYSQQQSQQPYHHPTPPYGPPHSHSAQGYGPSSATQAAAPPPQALNSTASVISQINPAILAEIPEEQKAMVIHVLSMTPEMISRLPPQDRANIVQLRSTLGL